MCPLNLTFLKLEPPQLCDFENEILVLESHCCSCSGSITQALRVEAMQLLRCYTSCIRVVIYSVSSKDIVVHPAHLLWVSMHPPDEFGSLPQFHGSITHVIEMMVLESKRDDQMPLPWLLDESITIPSNHFSFENLASTTCTFEVCSINKAMVSAPSLKKHRVGRFCWPTTKDCRYTLINSLGLQESPLKFKNAVLQAITTLQKCMDHFCQSGLQKSPW